MACYSLISSILVVPATFKFLTTGHECEYNDSNVALFKFNTNRPDRLSYIASIDPNTGKQEEWCIREWLGSHIHVVPDSADHKLFSWVRLFEVYFLEIVH